MFFSELLCIRLFVLSFIIVMKWYYIIIYIFVLYHNDIPVSFQIEHYHVHYIVS